MIGPKEFMATIRDVYAQRQAWVKNWTMGVPEPNIAGPVLVYADWLEERGECGKGELLRLTVKLKEMPEMARLLEDEADPVEAPSQTLREKIAERRNIRARIVELAIKPGMLGLFSDLAHMGWYGVDAWNNIRFIKRKIRDDLQRRQPTKRSHPSQQPKRAQRWIAWAQRDIAMNGTENPFLVTARMHAALVAHLERQAIGLGVEMVIEYSDTTFMGAPILVQEYPLEPGEALTSSQLDSGSN